MRRPYTASQYAQAVDLARRRVPGLAITTDVIAGFPGESAVEFDQSFEFVAQMQFARVHVFSYSPREGTVAAGLPLQVPDSIKAERAARMQSLANACAEAFARSFYGQELVVLWEAPEGTVGSAQAPLWSGYSDNYIRVLAHSSRDLRNEMTPAVLIGSGEGGALGRIAWPTADPAYPAE
jgi:threonylcarbamoyladenosine tRNA methylthiotransferase MtaB